MLKHGLIRGILRLYKREVTYCLKIVLVGTANNFLSYNPRCWILLYVISRRLLSMPCCVGDAPATCALEPEPHSPYLFSMCCGPWVSRGFNVAMINPENEKSKSPTEEGT